MRALGRAIGTALGGLLVVVLVLGLWPLGAPEIPAGRAGRHAVVAGTRIRYLQEGQGPDVLLIHGGMGTLEDWEPVRGELASWARVTSYDRPGHGWSERSPEGHTLTSNARIASALIAALGLRDVTLVGHSYGGGVALAVAAADPTPLRALVLVGSIGAPPAASPSRLHRLLAVPVVGAGLLRLLAPVLGPRIIRRTLERSFRPGGVPPDFVATRVASWNQPIHLLTWAEQRVSVAGDVPALAARYAAIDRPTVLVHGSEDAMVPVESADRLRALLPSARMIELEATGHYVQYVRPQDLVDAIRLAAGAPAR